MTETQDKLCCGCHFWSGSCRFHVNATASSEICEKWLPKVSNEYRRTKETDYGSYGGKVGYLQTEILKAVNELGKVRQCLKGEKGQQDE